MSSLLDLRYSSARCASSRLSCGGGSGPSYSPSSITSTDFWKARSRAFRSSCVRVCIFLLMLHPRQSSYLLVASLPLIRAPCYRDGLLDIGRIHTQRSGTQRLPRVDRYLERIQTGIRLTPICCRV